MEAARVQRLPVTRWEEKQVLHRSIREAMENISFIGFAPVENPKAVVYAIVDEPDVENQANSVLAQEIVKEIYTELLPYLNVFPDDTDGVTGEGSETGTDDPNVAAPVQEDDTENSAENSNIENGGLTNAELDLINEE